MAEDARYRSSGGLPRGRHHHHTSLRAGRKYGRTMRTSRSAGRSVGKALVRARERGGAPRRGALSSGARAKRARSEIGCRATESRERPPHPFHPANGIWLREHRISHGRRIEVRPPLFPGYCFLTVEAQWYAARWSIGVIGLIMDGVRPARVADQVIDDLRKRERNGLIELPQRSGLKPGDQVRILQGSFAGSSDSMLACELTRCWHATSRAGAGVAGVARRTAACRARKECRKGD